MCSSNRYVACLLVLIKYFSIATTASSGTYQEEGVLLSSIHTILSKYPYQYIFGQQLGGGWENITNEARSHAIDMQRVSSLETLCSNRFQEAKNDYKGSNLKRLACCSKYPYAFYYLHNVRIKNKKILYYVGRSSYYNSSIDPQLHHQQRKEQEQQQQQPGIKQLPPSAIKLPDIISIIRQVQHRFNMEVVVVQEDFDPTPHSCTSFFNGTLHVAGRYTTHNLFHVVNDNIIPLLSQIVLDLILRHNMINRPRALLEGFQPTDREELKQLSIMHSIVPTVFTLQSINNMCFHTVIWGNGMKLIYTHLLSALRRVVADLLREVIAIAYQPPNPFTFRAADKRQEKSRIGKDEAILNGSSLVFSARVYDHSSSSSIIRGRSSSRDSSSDVTSNRRTAETLALSTVDYSLQSQAAATSKHCIQRTSNVHRGQAVPYYSPCLTRRPMNIVIFTRGSSGMGRSMAKEQLLKDKLIELGANALICCDFRTVSMRDQLGYAYHADAIIGLHGAGLVNNYYAPRGVITVELKTIYGYDLTLFAVSGEARLGSHVELNIKPYHQWGKPQSKNRPMDAPLIDRIVAGIDMVLQYQDREIEHINVLKKRKGWKVLYLSSLAAMNFSESLFEAINHTRSIHAITGDLIMHAYPLKYYEEVINISRGNGGDDDDVGKGRRLYDDYSGIISSPPFQQLDSLMHILGPISKGLSSMIQACSRLVVGAYWNHISADTNRFCLPCTTSSSLSLSSSYDNLDMKNYNMRTDFKTKKSHLHFGKVINVKKGGLNNHNQNAATSRVKRTNLTSTAAVAVAVVVAIDDNNNTAAVMANAKKNRNKRKSSNLLNH